MIGGKAIILRHFTVLHGHAVSGNAGNGSPDEIQRNMYRRFRNDVANAMPDQYFHRNAGIGLNGIGIVHKGASNAIRNLINMRWVYTFVHYAVLLHQFPLALSRRSIRSSCGDGPLL